MRVNDARLLGIPRWRSKITIIYPHHDTRWEDYPDFSVKVELDERISVARVQPRTSKGITDLLLPRTSIGYPPIVPLRSIQPSEDD